MRYSSYYVPTVKETPADAEVISHKLMLRAGMIRPLARGIYDYLPLGLRVIRKVEAIVREEMNRAGAHELLLPMVQPAGLWKETQRWDAYIDEGLLAVLKDRHQREYCLGPTHEEVITDLVRRDVRSYRDLPVNLYQIQTKFRDEIRPRFGLMRGREFIMKDAYSFDRDEKGAKASYQVMFEAYKRIFTRCGLSYRPVEALAGNIGGSLSHEFQVLAESGEDAIAVCASCDYAANVEKVEVLQSDSEASIEGVPEIEEVATPGKSTVEEVTEFLKVKPESLVKTLLYISDQGPVAALVRGDHSIHEDKLKGVLGVNWMNLAKDQEVEELTGAPVGFAGPVSLKGVRLVADHAVRQMAGFVTGANGKDSHYKNVCHGRDFSLETYLDIRRVLDGDPCPRCREGKLSIVRGIEVGHVFYLGTKYSESMDATILDEDGKKVPIEMGCYGIGIGRTVAAAIEQNNDKNGICWPLPIAPFQVTVITANPDDEEVVATADTIYRGLEDHGLEVLYDDRHERAGHKFKDSDLIGIPYRIVVGARGLKEGLVEVKTRTGDFMEKVAVDDAVHFVSERINKEFEALADKLDDALSV